MKKIKIKIDCVEREIEISEAMFKSITGAFAPPKIMVPDNIRFIDYANCPALCFGNDQMLYFSHGRWHVNEDDGRPALCPHLEPCERGDLRAGDWALGVDGDIRDIDVQMTDEEDYFLILNNAEHVYATDSRSVVVSNESYKHWNRVVF